MKNDGRRKGWSVLNLIDITQPQHLELSLILRNITKTAFTFLNMTYLMIVQFQGMKR